MPELSSIINGKKFMWDCVVYESEKDAQDAKKTFEAKGFKVEIVSADNQSFIYTRRVVTEVVVEGEAPV